MSPPSFFGAMATVFRGMYEFAREMERLEKGEEKQRRAAERETETAPAARSASLARLRFVAPIATDASSPTREISDVDAIAVSYRASTVP